MAVHLSTPVSALPGVGPVAAADLRRLGIVSVADLLTHVPFRYDDFSKTKPLPALRRDDAVTVEARVRTIATRPSRNNPRLRLTEAILENDSGEAKAMWFNQPYLEKTLRPGTTWSFAGRVDGTFGAVLANPVFEPVGARVLTGRLVPVYGLTGSLTQRRMRLLAAAALPAVAELAEWLPPDVAAGRMPLAVAVRAVHAPASQDALARAVDRLKFDELFLHQLMFAAVRAQRQARQARALPVDADFLKAFVAGLPFALTDAQRRAAWDAVQDMARPSPMNRLLEGDVGSGKTVVAAIAIAGAAHAGVACAYLAPTELLAAQQQEALRRFLPDLAIGLLTGSRARLGGEDAPRDALMEALAAGRIDCLVGTHALIQDGVKMPNLCLVVVDEQHRFGVQQRHALLGEQGDAPHLLSMTATPIPRSLALTLYGDLDVSVLRQKPGGRRPVATSLVPETQAASVWAAVRRELDAGRQAYVVCPLIDPSDALGAASVTELGASLRRGALKGRTVGMLHGKLKSDEKTGLLADFRDGKIDALVSTTVVEVGVDVPNATAMVVMGAERFGLAQLHQLRGRVGRSDLPSACYLVARDVSRASQERLRALVDCADGFALAEKDLQLRGSGNVFGDAQSGWPDFKLATPADTGLMREAHEAARALLASDPDLSHHPALKENVRAAFDEVHLE